MKNTYTVLLLFSVLMYAQSSVADSVFYTGKNSIKAENRDVIVLHEYDIQVENQPDRNDSLLKLNSTLRIIRKSDNSEIFSQESSPLTALVPLDNSGYFVGLSHLNFLSTIKGYNFILFNENGDVLKKDMIKNGSGHCNSLRQSVTNFIYWFDRDNPEVRPVYNQDKLTRVIVQNPYDRTAPENLGECVIDLD